MATKIVLPNGKVTLTLLAGESVAVYTKGTAKVSQVVGYPNHPYTESQIGTVTAGETVFGSYASGATIILEADPYGIWYEQGTAPVVTDARDSQLQGAPVAVDVTGAVSAAAIQGGLVTSSTAAAVAGTVPTGTVFDAANTYLAIGDSVDWSVINTGPNTFTVTAATGHTIVGAAAVATATSGRFRTRKTATATYVTYRVC